MEKAVNRFYNSIPNHQELTVGGLVEFFVYFLTVEQGEKAALPKKIIACFEACDLKVPSNVYQYLSGGLYTKPPIYIKQNGGYRLENSRRKMLVKNIGNSVPLIQTSNSLRQLETKITDGPRKDFLKETIHCFEVGAERASIVMCWILVMDHLFEYIFTHKLIEFNAALKGNSYKTIKKITVRDDFGEIPESRFIELCRQAKIISNDVRKILDQKLGTRNTAAHPSGVKVAKTKVIDFIEDLVTNVVIKYKI